jgi:hypothetical protein
LEGSHSTLHFVDYYSLNGLQEEGWRLLYQFIGRVDDLGFTGRPRNTRISHYLMAFPTVEKLISGSPRRFDGLLTVFVSQAQSKRFL